MQHCLNDSKIELERERGVGVRGLALKTESLTGILMCLEFMHLLSLRPSEGVGGDGKRG